MRSTLLASLVLAAAVSAVPVFAQDAAPAPVANQQVKEQSLPVKSVTLFSSGVGYFEHFGQVKGDGKTELNFKTVQINDILKSLVLQDLDGGKVSTVQYPSQDPVEKTLKSFQVDITGNPPLADLLQQLRGAKVTVQVANEKYTGIILGVEKRKVPVKDAQPIDEWIINLIDGANIRQLELSKINDVKLEDPKLQEELAKALAALAQARDQDKKSVVINFNGQGDRRIRLGYVVESPVWKTSYRLVMGDDASNLQGWAIVENQTDNDWNDVQLNLVSGRPISFVMNLYQPLYIPRPTVELELYASLRPQVYDEGKNIGAARKAEKEFRGAARAPAPAAAAEMAADGAFAGEELKKAMDPTASVQSVASAAKLGELFQYTVGNVSLPRQKSAMIPIITDKVEVEKLSIYNRAVLLKHPLNGAMVTNSTDKHLLQGPITVFAAGAYAGDAQIDNVPPGQKRLLSYGVDLQVIVQPRDASASDTLSGKIVKGVLQVTHKSTLTTTYETENKSDRDKTLVIEHPLMPDWKLVNTAEPMETTQSLYRFKTPAPKGAGKAFVVQQERIHSQTIAILPMDPETILIYAQRGQIPGDVRKALQEVARRKQAMFDVERKIDENQQQVTQITQEQARIRENMKTVDKNSQYYNRLLNTLNEQETELDKLRTETKTLRKQLEDTRKALEEYLNGLSVG